MSTSLLYTYTAEAQRGLKRTIDIIEHNHDGFKSPNQRNTVIFNYTDKSVKVIMCTTNCVLLIPSYL